MSDNLFERLKQVLDDGLILTPDMSEAIDAITCFEENDQRVIQLMDQASHIIHRSDRFSILVGAELMSSRIEKSDRATSISRSLCVGQVVGIMLGLLAAERIKTEVTK